MSAGVGKPETAFIAGFMIQGWANALQLTTSISHTIAQGIAPNVLICPAADVKMFSVTDAEELCSGGRPKVRQLCMRAKPPHAGRPFSL